MLCDNIWLLPTSITTRVSPHRVQVIGEYTGVRFTTCCIPLQLQSWLCHWSKRLSNSNTQESNTCVSQWYAWVRFLPHTSFWYLKVFWDILSESKTNARVRIMTESYQFGWKHLFCIICHPRTWGKDSVTSDVYWWWIFQWWHLNYLPEDDTKSWHGSWERIEYSIHHGKIQNNTFGKSTEHRKSKRQGYWIHHSIMKGGPGIFKMFP